MNDMCHRHGRALDKHFPFKAPSQDGLNAREGDARAPRGAHTMVCQPDLGAIIPNIAPNYDNYINTLR